MPGNKAQAWAYVVFLVAILPPGAAPPWHWAPPGHLCRLASFSCLRRAILQPANVHANTVSTSIATHHALHTLHPVLEAAAPRQGHRWAQGGRAACSAPGDACGVSIKWLRRLPRALAQPYPFANRRLWSVVGNCNSTPPIDALWGSGSVLGGPDQGPQAKRWSVNDGHGYSLMSGASSTPGAAPPGGSMEKAGTPPPALWRVPTATCSVEDRQRVHVCPTSRPGRPGAAARGRCAAQAAPAPPQPAPLSAPCDAGTVHRRVYLPLGGECALESPVHGSPCRPTPRASLRHTASLMQLDSSWPDAARSPR